MLDSIYGRITEHPEYPVTDSRRFTVEILPHDFVPDRTLKTCYRCGFVRTLAVHGGWDRRDVDDEITREGRAMAEGGLI